MIILGIPAQLYVFLILTIVAMFITQYFNKDDSFKIKIVKFFGVLVSTMPIIGVAQGLVAKSKYKAYSEACFYQAAAGMVAYAVIKYVIMA